MHLVSLYQVIDKMISSYCLSKRESGFPFSSEFPDLQQEEGVKSKQVSKYELLISPKAVA